MEVLLQIARVVAVIALLCFAAALATPPNRLPLALRGLRRIMRKDAGLSDADASAKVSPVKRAISFVVIIIAILMALF